MGRGGEKAPAGSRVISAQELSKHNKPGDAWLAIRGKVYDVSTWTDHPGGRVIYSAAGTDSTDSFVGFHSGKAYEMLDQFYIGAIDQGKGGIVVNEFEKEYREMYAKVKTAGLMQASIPYYIWKLSSTLAILGVAAYLTLSFDSFAIKMVGAFLVALFWQQCGWLAHDFGHHQVFKNRKYNDYIVLMVGNLWQAFSLEWWKNKHNTHHAIPNLHESENGAHDGDPDIDTLPFLAWSKTLMEKVLPGGAVDSPFARFCVKYQAMLYFPILFFARITWALQSISYAFDYEMPFFGSEVTKRNEAKAALAQHGSSVGALRYPNAERVLLALHYTWYFTLVYLSGGFFTAACFFFVSQTFSGLLLALSFGVGHNGMEVFDYAARPPFAELQIRTTRNVEDVWLNGWFMGGLHYQVEHHLFPMVPRHNLKYIRAMIEPLCKKHGVPYHSTGLVEGNVEVLAYLKNITHALEQFPGI